ncbi:MAG: hypothetical protein V9G12_08660 [Microthrixaceae bacterium]
MAAYDKLNNTSPFTDIVSFTSTPMCRNCFPSPPLPTAMPPPSLQPSR